MENRLSKRERRLIFAAVVFLLVMVSFNFVINPMYKRYMTKSEELDALYSEKSMLELTLQNESLTHAAYEKAEKEFNKIKERYPVVMPNEEVDRILTGICLKNSLSPVALNMSSGVEHMAGQNDPAVNGEATQPRVAYTTVNANMILTGGYDSLKGLINEVDRLDYIRINRVVLSNKKNDGGTLQSDISVSFEITMLNDTPLTAEDSP